MSKNTKDSKNLEDFAQLQALRAVSPLDGRYQRHIQDLEEICSEFGLINHRVFVEVKWLAHLLFDMQLIDKSELAVDLFDKLDSIQKDFDVHGAAAVRAIERRTNHDVKAVEYYVKDRLVEAGFDAIKEYVHFGCTSEDINNLAYAKMLADARAEVLLPSMTELVRAMLEFAMPYVETPMLSRTHGQTASPTTVGKELVNVAARLTHWIERLNNVEIRGKMNGAVGNFNAHVSAASEFDWPTASKQFVESLGFVSNAYTTQIEPHDWIAEYLNALVGFNQTLLDFDRDVWSYISLGYFKQKQVEGEIGSSTMPHKVNPIDFENSEGNLGVGSALARHLAEKLLVSRWQRDLTDSTALRNVGTALGHTVIAIKSAMRGIGKLEVNGEQIAGDLNDAWEVLSEPVQTVMRRHGNEDPYELVKTVTRGRQLDEALYKEMLETLPLTDELRAQLRNLRPETYIGLAPRLAREGIEELTTRLDLLCLS